MFLFSLFILASCSSYQTRGTVVSANSLQRIVIGQTTRDDIINILGHPSTTSVFDNGKSLIYISEGVKDTPLRLPVVKNRSVFIFAFNSNDILKTMTTKDLTDGKKISFASQTTPPVGSRVSLWQQILGNFGRFGS